MGDAPQVSFEKVRAPIPVCDQTQSPSVLSAASLADCVSCSRFLPPSSAESHIIIPACLLLGDIAVRRSFLPF
jgi:hypothetical protein